MSRRGSSMVEVDREKLVAALEEKLKNERNRIASETLQFNDKRAVARKQYILNLKEFMEKVAAGGEIPSDSYKLEKIVEKGCNFPDAVKQGEVASIERALRKLALVHSQTLVVGDDDEYLSLI